MTRSVRERKVNRPSEPKGLAAVLQESQDLLDLAEEAGHLGVFEWQVQEGTLRPSRKFLSMYGLTEFDGRYDSWLKCIVPEDVPGLVAHVNNAFAEKARQSQVEFRIVRPADDALRWIEARKVIFYDTEGRAIRVVGVNVDVTERKRSLAQLQALNETLEERVKERTRELEAENEARKTAEETLRQAHKMEAVGQLTGGIAHDFNNLLTIILGGLDIIGRQIPNLDTSPVVSRIVRGKDMAIESARRAAKLISRLLAFARQQPLDPKNVDANKLVTGTCELLRRTLGEAVSLEAVLAGGVWRILVDANQLENALVNLAVNARDAMPNGGRVTIETANCHLDEGYVSMLAEPVRVGQYVMIAVADIGGGMERATVERVFEPFFTTKGIGKGTGLGLSQVYGFVRQSAGHVRIYSEVGEGTTVKIYLPRHAGENDHPAEIERMSAATGAIGAECILVVEDDDALRTYAVEVLNDLGYSVLAAPNPAVALEIIDRGHDVDLLFTDIVMPGGMNGRQLADEVMRRRPGMKVLFTTGYTRNAIVHQGRLDPGVEMIGKPFTFQELGARIRAILDRK